MKIFLKRISDLCFGFLLTFLIIAISTVILLYTKPLYRYMIQKEGLFGKYDLSTEEIMENYDALVDHNTLFGKDTLDLPHLPASESAIIHFKEVRTIFVFLQVGIPVSIFLLSFYVLYCKMKKTGHGYLLVGGLLSCILPFFVGLAAFFDFGSLFVRFHEIMFQNDYWIFDPVTDPIITFLPEPFFLLMASGILTLTFSFGLFVLFLYFLSKKKNRTRKEGA